MKLHSTLLPFAAALLSVTSARASCPQVEGKYTYTCSIDKDPVAKFAEVLEVKGQMLVQQADCDSYAFTNLDTSVSESFLLTDIENAQGTSRVEIDDSDAGSIRFRTIEHDITKNFSLRSLSSWITRAKIKTDKHGFSLKGTERSRVLGIFGRRHSSFRCEFNAEK